MCRGPASTASTGGTGSRRTTSTGGAARPTSAYGSATDEWRRTTRRREEEEAVDTGGDSWGQGHVLQTRQLRNKNQEFRGASRGFLCSQFK